MWLFLVELIVTKNYVPFMFLHDLRFSKVGFGDLGFGEVEGHRQNASADIYSIIGAILL